MSRIENAYSTIVLADGQRLHDVMPIVLAENVASAEHMDCIPSFHFGVQDKSNAAEGEYGARSGSMDDEAPEMIIHLDDSSLSNITSCMNPAEHTPPAYGTHMPASDKSTPTQLQTPQQYIMIPVMETSEHIKGLGFGGQSADTYLVQVPCEKQGTKWVNLNAVCGEVNKTGGNMVLVANEDHDDINAQGVPEGKIMLVKESSLDAMEGYYLSEVASGEKTHHGRKEVRYPIAGSSSQRPAEHISTTHVAQEDPPNIGSQAYHVLEVADSKVLSTPAKAHQVANSIGHIGNPQLPVNLKVSSQGSKLHHSSLDQELHSNQMLSTHLDSSEGMHEHLGLVQGACETPHRFLGGTGAQKRLSLPSPIAGFKSPCSDGGNIVAGRVVCTNAASHGSELNYSILDNSEPQKKPIHLGRVLQPFK